MKHVTQPSYGFQVMDDFVLLLPEMVGRPADYVLSALYINRRDNRSKLALAQIMEEDVEDREYPGLYNVHIPAEFSDA